MSGLFPECERRGCSWSIQDDIVTVQRIVKHGDGGEAMLRIDTFTLVMEPPPSGMTVTERIAWRDTALVRRMSTWFDEVHAYEDVRYTDPTKPADPP